MNTKFTYGLFLTIAQAAFSLVMYFCGYQTEKLATGQYLNLIAFPITIILLWMGIKAVREESPDKSLSYGQGVGAGALISLYSGLMGGVYNFVHFKYIAPESFDYQMEVARSKWAAAGIGDAQMEKMESVTRNFMNPIFTSIVTVIMGVIIGVVISLIIAAILKRPAPATAVPPALG